MAVLRREGKILKMFTSCTMMNYEINKQDVYLFLLVSSVILAAMPAAISAALLAPVAKSSLSKNIIFNV